jgi:hypothetical protein
VPVALLAQFERDALGHLPLRLQERLWCLLAHDANPSTKRHAIW